MSSSTLSTTDVYNTRSQSNNDATQRLQQQQHQLRQLQQQQNLAQQMIIDLTQDDDDSDMEVDVTVEVIDLSNSPIHVARPTIPRIIQDNNARINAYNDTHDSINNNATGDNAQIDDEEDVGTFLPPPLPLSRRIRRQQHQQELERQQLPGRNRNRHQQQVAMLTQQRNNSHDPQQQGGRHDGRTTITTTAMTGATATAQSAQNNNLGASTPTSAEETILRNRLNILRNSNRPNGRTSAPRQVLNHGQTLRRQQLQQQPHPNQPSSTNTVANLTQTNNNRRFARASSTTASTGAQFGNNHNRTNNYQPIMTGDALRELGINLSDDVLRLLQQLRDSRELMIRFPQNTGATTANRGATVGLLSQLPIAQITPEDVAVRDGEEPPTCCICFEEYVPHVDQRKILPCLHKFHAHCIDEWLGRDACCPICKHRLS